MNILTTEEFSGYISELRERFRLTPVVSLIGDGRLHGKIVDTFIEAVQKTVDAGIKAWGPLRGTLTTEDIRNPKADKAGEALNEGKEEEWEEWLNDPEPLYKFPKGKHPLSDELWEIWQLSPGFVFRFNLMNQCVEVWPYLWMGNMYIETDYPFNLTPAHELWFRIPFCLLSEEAADEFKEMLDTAIERWAPKEDEEEEDDDD